jgi:hypothetical protein
MNLSNYLRKKGFLHITDALNQLGKSGWLSFKKEFYFEKHKEKTIDELKQSIKEKQALITNKIEVSVLIQLLNLKTKINN